MFAAAMAVVAAVVVKDVVAVKPSRWACGVTNVELFQFYMYLDADKIHREDNKYQKNTATVG